MKKKWNTYLNINQQNNTYTLYYNVESKWIYMDNIVLSRSNALIIHVVQIIIILRFKNVTYILPRTVRNFFWIFFWHLVFITHLHIIINIVIFAIVTTLYLKLFSAKPLAINYLLQWKYGSTESIIMFHRFVTHNIVVNFRSPGEKHNRYNYYSP